MNKNAPKRINLNGIDYVRADLANQNQQSARPTNLTSALNTSEDGDGTVTIKIFNGRQNRSRQNNRHQGNRKGNNNRRAQ